MTWRIRHEGSPRAVEGLSLAEVVEGLQDGLWEPTDEVMGPLDHDWVALETHPQFADIAIDLETLVPAIKNWVKKERKNELLIDAAGVEWGVIVAIQDAAKGADVQKVHLLERTEEGK